MFSSGLHPPSGDGLDGLIEVELTPSAFNTSLVRDAVRIVTTSAIAPSISISRTFATKAGTSVNNETVRLWWSRFGTILAAEIRRSRVQAMRHVQHRQWHLDDVFVKINGVKHDLWRAVDHEGEVLESFVTRRRDKKAANTAALSVPRNSMKRHGQTEIIVTDRLA